MKRHFTSLLLCGSFFISSLFGANVNADESKSSDLNFKVPSIDGAEVNLADYSGKVVVVVNVASRCGATPQYADLQAIYEKYKDQGLVVLGFPCNQFGRQEPGSESDIKEFCSTKYAVTFPMFSKVEVNGAAADPLFKNLTDKDVQPAGSGPVGWNFEKFVINRNGELAARFKTRTNPTDPAFISVIEQELAAE